MTRYIRCEAVVPAHLIGQEPEDGTMVDVVFDWHPGTEPSGMSGPPENYDPGEGPDFSFVEPANMTDEQDDAVVTWLMANWEPPADEADPDDLRDQMMDDAMMERGQ